jgi:phosphatidylserine decarboxylase
MKNNLFVIIKNGWSYLAYSVGAFFVFKLLDLDMLATLAFAMGILFIYLFRNPERELSIFGKNSIVSPVDGNVTQIIELDDEEYAYRVDIQSSFSDVSVLRIPLTGKVQTVQLRCGTRLSSESKLFNDLNESCELVFINEYSNKIKVVHTLSQSFAPLCIDIISSQNVIQTARYGFMLSGVTSIYLPSNVRLNVNVANELKASQTLLGYFS